MGTATPPGTRVDLTPARIGPLGWKWRSSVAWHGTRKAPLRDLHPPREIVSIPRSLVQGTEGTSPDPTVWLLLLFFFSTKYPGSSIDGHPGQADPGSAAVRACPLTMAELERALAFRVSSFSQTPTPHWRGCGLAVAGEHYPAASMRGQSQQCASSTAKTHGVRYQLFLQPLGLVHPICAHMPLVVSRILTAS